MVKGQGKRKYTAEFRQGAASLVLKQKRSVKEAAADLGMPPATLNAWVSQARNGQGAFRPDEQKDLATREEARAAIFDSIEVFYNRQRIHSSLGYLSPEQFEASRR